MNDSFAPPADLPKGALPARHSAGDRTAHSLAERCFSSSSIPLIDKLESFPRFTTKRALAKFLARVELYKLVSHSAGVIVECGVLHGAGFFTWAQLVNIFEPSNHTRKIIGFDTFEGFPSVSEQMDNSGVQRSAQGDLAGSPLTELQQSAARYDLERHLSHIPNIEFVQGDFMKTAAAYLEANPHLIIGLLYLDFDLYEPTKKALELFLPRMPRGSVVAFDELNCNSFPGETRAFDEVMGIGKVAVRRFPFDPWISYVTL